MTAPISGLSQNHPVLAVPGDDGGRRERPVGFRPNCRRSCLIERAPKAVCRLPTTFRSFAASTCHVDSGHHPSLLTQALSRGPASLRARVRASNSSSQSGLPSSISANSPPAVTVRCAFQVQCSLRCYRRVPPRRAGWRHSGGGSRNRHLRDSAQQPLIAVNGLGTDHGHDDHYDSVLIWQYSVLFHFGRILRS